SQSVPVTTGPVTTPSVPTTTTPSWVTSTLCTTTATSTPKCEYEIGNWCAPPVPDWSDKIGCIKAAAVCKLQFASCFKKAGLEGAIGCFKYIEFCKSIKLSCAKCLFGPCGKDNTNPPSRPVTSTIVTPCKPSQTKPVPTATPTVCPPPADNICVDIGKSVCGVPLPIVNCNDDKAGFAANSLKLYNDEISSKSPVFPLAGAGNACAEACLEQFNQCKRFDFWDCKHSKRSGDDVEVPALVDGPQRRTLGLITQLKCKKQYAACLLANKKIKTTNQ
ncbi:hypothetical protein ED733_000006, partial [Metarhizium rileyi]